MGLMNGYFRDAGATAQVVRPGGWYACGNIGYKDAQPEAIGNERVVAFVSLKRGQSLDRAALQAHLHQQLSPYKRPAHIEVVEDLPMTHSGKILKRQLVLKTSA